MIATLCVLSLLIVAADADAQATARVPRGDIAAATGVFAGHPSDPPDTESFDDWYHASTLGILFGRYLSSNVKLEAELMLSREGERYAQRLIDVPGAGRSSIYLEQLTRTRGASGALVWQFFDNQWVHPFLMAGATADFDREAVHIPRQSSFRGDPRIPGNEVVLTAGGTEDLGTTTRLRALLGGGAKLYVTTRAFFRADTRIGIGSDTAGHVSFRLGFGADF